MGAGISLVGVLQAEGGVEEVLELLVMGRLAAGGGGRRGLAANVLQ